MKILKKALSTAAVTLLLSTSLATMANTLTPLIDDFSDSSNNSLSLPRQFLSDTMAGGQTQFDATVTEGVIAIKGEVVPPRGQPGWASTVLLLDPAGQPRDASHYEGVRMLIKINQGTFSVSANSTEVTNFDYHASPVMAKSDGNFHEIKIPFSQMRRAWSEQTALNPGTINSLSIVAYGLQKTPFNAEIDEVSFY